MDDMTEFVRELLRATDIVGLADDLALNPVPTDSGRFVANCPHCGTAQFVMDTGHQSYYCFACEEHGDAIAMLRAVTDCSFRDALLRLAQRAEIPCNVGNLLDA